MSQMKKKLERFVAAFGALRLHEVEVEAVRKWADGLATTFQPWSHKHILKQRTVNMLRLKEYTTNKGWEGGVWGGRLLLPNKRNLLLEATMRRP